MIDSDDLYAAEGRLWCASVPADCPRVDKLLWTMSAELACTLECALDIADAQAVAPAAITALEDADSYLRARGVPRPHAVALFLLRLERYRAGLHDRSINLPL